MVSPNPIPEQTLQTPSMFAINPFPPPSTTFHVCYLDLRYPSSRFPGLGLFNSSSPLSRSLILYLSLVPSYDLVLATSSSLIHSRITISAFTSYTPLACPSCHCPHHHFSSCWTTRRGLTGGPQQHRISTRFYTTRPNHTFQSP